MYLPEQFEETRPEELQQIMTAYPFGTLVTHGPSGLDANHLPFVLDPDASEHGQLRAHVARGNAVWREIRDGDEVLVVFDGADAYISPNWFPSKHEFHRQVPTWNYRTVHVRGTARVRDDARFVRGVVARLSRTHEARVEPSRPWKMSDSPKEFINDMLELVVGIEIDITSIVGKWKLSQNKEERDRMGAVKALRERGAHDMADAMQATLGERG